MSVPVASHPIKHLRTKLIAVAVVIFVAAAGRLVITWVNDLLSRLPTAAAPKPPTHGNHGLKDEDAYVRLRSVQELGARNLGNAVVLAMFAELVATDSAPHELGIVDGAIFAMVWKATDPEILLILEARRDKSEEHWQYVLVRFNFREMWVTRNDQLIWRVGVSPV